MNTLTQVFKSLRKQGFIARQNYKCCGNCAGYQIAMDVEEMTPCKREACKGAVFFTRQGIHRENKRSEESTYTLKFGEVDTEKYGKVGRSTQEVGQALVDELKKFGLNPVWNGDPNLCVKVTINE